MKRRWTDTLTLILGRLCCESSPPPLFSLITNTLPQPQRRLDKFGANSLDEEENKSLFAMVLEQFDDPMVKILLTAAGISFVIALFEEEKEGMSLCLLSFRPVSCLFVFLSRFCLSCLLFVPTSCLVLSCLVVVLSGLVGLDLTYFACLVRRARAFSSEICGTWCHHLHPYPQRHRGGMAREQRRGCP
jgi:hypothetical protein